MNRNIFKQSVAALALLSSGNGALAVPMLQLGILDATYDAAPGVETSIATSDAFTLYAFLTPGNGANVDLGALLADMYYISAAVMPKTGPSGATLGSFSYDGGSVNVTSDMTYGTPPLENVASLVAGSDPGDLPSHDIFETYFYERAFNFSSLSQFAPLNVQDNATLSGLTAGTGMYYATFDIDVSNLMADIDIHFDLYNSAVVDCGNKQNCVVGDIDVDDFAPFSHDAQSNGGAGGEGGSGFEPVPTPGSTPLLLLGLALMGAVFRYKKSSGRVNLTSGERCE